MTQYPFKIDLEACRVWLEERERNGEDYVNNYQILPSAKGKFAFREAKRSALVPLTIAAPFLQEGDHTNIYKTRGPLAERLPPTVFNINSTVPARISLMDLAFMDGFAEHFQTQLGTIPQRETIFQGENNLSSIFLDKKQRLDFCPPKILSEYFTNSKILDETYFIVDVGHAHLPGVAVALQQRGVDCSFVIQDSINPRFQQALKYWAATYNNGRSIPLQPRRMATFLDCHRADGSDDNLTYDVHDNWIHNYLPSVDQLRSSGINRVCVLLEAEVNQTWAFEGGYPDISLHNILNQYQSNGFPVVCKGIDMEKTLGVYTNR